VNVGGGGTEIPRHRIQLVGGVRQRRQRGSKPRAIDAGATPEIGIGGG
jgi:hypothetical protein